MVMEQTLIGEMAEAVQLCINDLESSTTVTA